MFICKKRTFIQSLGNDNSISIHTIEYKIHVVVDYGSQESYIVFGSDLTTHAICGSFLMIIGKKRTFVQILASDNSICNHPIDFKMYMVVDYCSGKRCLVFGFLEKIS